MAFKKIRRRKMRERKKGKRKKKNKATGIRFGRAYGLTQRSPREKNTRRERGGEEGDEK